MTPTHQTFFKIPAWRSKKYLEHVRQFPCCVCGKMPVEAHHVRNAVNSGTGMKPGDCWCISLCPDHHREMHQKGIISFQKEHEINIYQQLFLIAKDWIEKI